jgi:hypothetical protein
MGWRDSAAVGEAARRVRHQTRDRDRGRDRGPLPLAARPRLLPGTSRVRPRGRLRVVAAGLGRAFETPIHRWWVAPGGLGTPRARLSPATRRALWPAAIQIASSNAWRDTTLSWT